MKSKLFIFSLILIVFVFLHWIQCDHREYKIIPLTHGWEKPLPHQDIPVGLTSLSAEACGVCHIEHFKEWALSTHALAWKDLQFQAEIKKESSPYLCINCHTPLQNQQEYLVEGLINGDIYKPLKKKNPDFDKTLQQEGITCAGCHVRNQVIIGPTGTTKAPHKTIKDTAFLSEQLCISCHNASAIINPTLVCTFETGDEWRAGPYFGKKNCIQCHMETTEREIAPGYGIRKSHAHFFPGSGIPKFDTLETRMLNGLGIYPKEPKKMYALMDTLIFTIKVKNEFAGHRLPTGDPERFFNIDFALKNAAGHIRSSKTERIGEQWLWYPEAKKLSDNNLMPGEERSFTFSYPLVLKEHLTLIVKITKHRLNQESATYNKITDRYPLFITIFEKEYSMTVK
ncbi:MAG: multiheme c-type cytochrome [Saprospiraceae bacterium]|nr:multiheme c-type cytochrome [Saprospiraceae bacterium]